VPIFYDSMISKLAAWAEDRPGTLARMRRALGEYHVAGVKTTVPFFTWLFEQPSFVNGQFHTRYLDELLASRHGQPFVDVSAESIELAAMSAALQSVLSAPELEVGEHRGLQSRAWTARARVEGLR
jgi:acetyl/propionyl-CoA carboxylase alpha subunit